MTEDLHQRLLAVVRQRMETATKAASTSRHSPRMAGRHADWRAEPYYTSEDTPYSVVLQPPLGQIVPASMEAHIADHIAANDPATILRHCERDLNVLERHRQYTFGGAPLRSADECLCGDRWPCPEILDLAAAYGIEVT